MDFVVVATDASLFFFRPETWLESRQYVTLLMENVVSSKG